MNPSEDADAIRGIELAERLTTKSGPRSKLMEAILVLLYARPLRTSEIASHLGYSSKYISSYMSYWRKKNLVYQEGGRWYLTPQGEAIAKEIIESVNNARFNEFLALARLIMAKPESQTKNNNVEQETKKAVKDVLSFFVNQTKSVNKETRNRNPEVCLKEILQKLDEDEREIMGFLLSKYSAWKSTYLYVDQIQEETGADVGWLFRVLRRLQTKKLLYLYHDPKLGVRVGFTQNVKTLLEECYSQ